MPLYKKTKEEQKFHNFFINQKWKSGDEIPDEIKNFIIKRIKVSKTHKWEFVESVSFFPINTLQCTNINV